MIGLAQMALRKAGACPRDEGQTLSHWWGIWSPVSRDAAESRPDDYDYSARYYRIIDRISRGERP